LVCLFLHFDQSPTFTFKSPPGPRMGDQGADGGGNNAAEHALEFYEDLAARALDAGNLLIVDLTALVRLPPPVGAPADPDRDAEMAAAAVVNAKTLTITDVTDVLADLSQSLRDLWNQTTEAVAALVKAVCARVCDSACLCVCHSACAYIIYAPE
jgi:hypothetical protein